jgi:SRSO17 transposase
MRSRFVALRIRPANVKLRRADPDGQLPVAWLLAEWPDGKDAPTDYWLSNLPADTPIERLVELGKLRWRVERTTALGEHWPRGPGSLSGCSPKGRNPRPVRDTCY